MSLLLTAIDKSAPTHLCDQIREKIAFQIAQGVLRPGTRLPSCRKLAEQLKVSTNTVVAAYQSLIRDGMVESRQRSGYFIHQNVRAAALPDTGADAVDHAKPLFDSLPPSLRPSGMATVRRPENWADYPYPFVCNQMDPARFPLLDWRSCCYQVLNGKQATRIGSDHGYADCVELVEEIRTRLLPRRGITARPDEILITVGAQQAIFLTSVLFGGPGNRIAVEDPCYPDARNIFQQFFGHVRPIPVDAQGIRVDQRLSGCQLLYTTPNRQYPLSVRMSPERREQLLSHAQRHGLIVIEDDYDGEADFDPRIPPALRSRAGGEQVIYLGTLSKSHNPGLRLGYMVASADFIAEARALRGMMIRHLPPFMQMAVAQFIHRGHHDALISRLQGVHEQRWRTTRDALERHFPDVDIHTGYGGTNFVIHADRPLDQARLRREALESGVVIEDISPCFSKPEEAERCLRLGVSAIGAKKIARGLRILRPIYERAQSR